MNVKHLRGIGNESCRYLAGQKSRKNNITTTGAGCFIVLTTRREIGSPSPQCEILPRSTVVGSTGSDIVLMENILKKSGLGEIAAKRQHGHEESRMRSVVVIPQRVEPDVDYVCDMELSADVKKKLQPYLKLAL